MLVKGCGVDLIEIARIAKALERDSFKNKIYTDFEQKDLQHRRAQSWAARFAAKEAVMKAVGLGWQQGLPFNCIEIYTNKEGQPKVRLLEPARQIVAELRITRFVLSLTHSKELAMAYVIALGEE